MKTKLAKLFSVGMLLASLSATADHSKLGDVMQLISDQAGGMIEFTKKVPADVDEKAFARVRSRCRGAQWLLSKADLEKGRVDEGDAKDLTDDKLVEMDLTPPKFSAVKPEEIAAHMKLYSETLQKVSSLIAAIDSEIKTQSEQEPAKRDFTVLKKLVVKDLTAEMTAAHKLFK